MEGAEVLSSTTFISSTPLMLRYLPTLPMLLLLYFTKIWDLSKK